MSDPLTFLEDWYASQCDGEWEHEFGVTIETLDNPGWELTVNLQDTEIEGRMLARRIVERTEHDWWRAWSDGISFRAACGPRNLSDALDAFREFVQVEAEPEP